MSLVGYTDGACFPNPGLGSYAWVVVNESNQLVEDSVSRKENSTSNEMELMALVSLLKVHGPLLTDVFSDSMYVVNTSMIWRHKWKKNNWHRREKKKDILIKNVSIIMELSGLLDNHPNVKIKWIKAHNGNEWNEHVDSLANNEVGLESKPHNPSYIKWPLVWEKYHNGIYQTQLDQIKIEYLVEQSLKGELK